MTLNVNVAPTTIEDRNALVVQFLALAGKEANRFWDTHYMATRMGSRDDVEQMARMALIEAADRYRPDVFKTKFITYATSRIRCRLLNFVRDTGVIRIPRYAWDKHDGQHPCRLAMLRAAHCRDLPTHRDGNDDPIEDYRAGLAEEVDDRDEIAKLRPLIARLTPREQEVISRRYLNGAEGRTLEAIGMHLGVTKERVRQIEGEALRKMRSYLGVSA